MTTTDHLADALAALRALPDVTALLRGQPQPAHPHRLIVLDHITSTPERTYERDEDEVTVQVNCYAPTYEDALALADEARTALDAAGFLWSISRPAPQAEGDPLRGVTTDYTR